MTLTLSRAIRSRCSLCPLFLTRSARPHCNNLSLLTSSSNLSCFSSLSSSSSIPILPKPQIPLFLRPPTISATLWDIKKWRNWAQSLAISVGSKFLESDNGPDADLLLREIRWLLEDVVEDFANFSHLGHHQVSNLTSLQERPDGINCLENGVTVMREFSQHGVDRDNELIKLRVDMDELYCLWKERIAKRRPFQYIVGCEHWRDMVLSVQEGVLIPRPETEMIVDMVEEVILKERELADGIWVDLGTGSGALGIGIARILEDGGKVVATDVSEVAVSVAKFNAERYGLQDKVEIRQGSWFEPLEDVTGGLSGVVSNPPYIPSDNISGLQAEVGRHEPRVALDGGENGMVDLLHLCEGLTSALRPGGFFALETNGDTQSDFIAKNLTNRSEPSFRDVKVVADIVGIRRFVTGFRR